MKRLIACLILLFLWVGCSDSVDSPSYLIGLNKWGVSGAEGYLQLLHRNYPNSVITSGYYDWRDVSVYRKKAGLHYGYDFALEKGSIVPAGWEGKVTNIIPWPCGEYAVEVSKEVQVTQYGHILPLVKVGDYVKVGEPVGKIVKDHLDLKIKISGKYFDFGIWDKEQNSFNKALPVDISR